MKPRTFLPSKSHPDYRKEEINYVLKSIFSDRKVGNWQWKGSPLIDPSRDVDSKDVLAEYYAYQIRRGLKKNAIKAVEVFGADALRLEVLEEQRVRDNETQYIWLESLKLKDQLGAAVCSVIRRWQNQILQGNLKTRRFATKRLRALLDALIPETRGKKGVKADPWEVLKFYYKELFRFYHIQNALRSAPGRISDKMKAASAAFDIPVEQIREFWGLDEDDEIKRGSGPFTLKDMARELTARRFRITHQTILNIIASYP